MAITNARMQIKRGDEVDFDAEKMLVGEWALSTDKRIVRICVAPNVCIRMATYDAFEVDMAQIDKILEECRTIEDVVKLINSQVSEKLELTIEYTNQAKQYRDEAEQFRNEAEAFAPDGYVELKETVASNTAKIDTIIEKAELNIKNTASGENIHLTDSANGKAFDFALYGKVTQDGEPTPDNPIEITVSGSDGSVEVVSCGKNLLQNTAESKTVNGITFTVNSDKSIAVNGTATATTNIDIISNNVILEKSGLLSGCPSGGSASTYNIQARNNTTSKWFNNYSGDTELTVGEYNRVILQIASGYTANNLVFRPMISFEGGEYEPYTETTSTIPTPDGLCGIKVSSGGNYTDENGQQWICDEVVKYADGSGKRIERIKHYSLAVADMNNSEDFPGWLNVEGLDEVFGSGRNEELTSQLLINVGNRFSINTDSNLIFLRKSVYNLTQTEWKTKYPDLIVEIYAIRATPIITDLSAEEIAEIEKLYTFYPVTNISNDTDCGMSITYMADAKNYIDNRLALIESAMLNNI